MQRGCIWDAMRIQRVCKWDAKGTHRARKGDAKGMQRGHKGDAKGTQRGRTVPPTVGPNLKVNAQLRRLGFWLTYN